MVNPNEKVDGGAEVLALVDDLFFQAKLAETARKLGVVLKTVSTGDALVESLAGTAIGDRPRLVVVDLNARQGAVEAVERLHSSGNPVPVIGFLSHVQTDLAERARAAGCSQVLPRSSFTANLSEILRQVKL
jgi:CheY-like chemotaxis protein